VSACRYARLSGVYIRESPNGRSRTQCTYLPTQKSDNTVKLELPSISSVHARGPVDTWYNSQYAPKPAVSSERLPALPQIQSHASGSSTSSSPRGDSISSASVRNGSASSNTSYATSVNGQTTGYKTPSPEQSAPSLSRAGQPVHAQSHQGSPYGSQDSYGYPPGSYNSMNQMQSYADVHPPHMSAATAHAPATAAPSGLPHYAYPAQPSMMQPGQHQYGSSGSGYAYGYQNGGVPSASSSMNNAMVPSTLQLPGKPSAHTFD
jgi:protein SOK2